MTSRIIGFNLTGNCCGIKTITVCAQNPSRKRKKIVMVGTRCAQTGLRWACSAPFFLRSLKEPSALKEFLHFSWHRGSAVYVVIGSEVGGKTTFLNRREQRHRFSVSSVISCSRSKEFLHFSWHCGSAVYVVICSDVAIRSS
jgi:hypothetical protein